MLRLNGDKSGVDSVAHAKNTSKWKPGFEKNNATKLGLAVNTEHSGFRCKQKHSKSQIGIKISKRAQLGIKILSKLVNSNVTRSTTEGTAKPHRRLYSKIRLINSNSLGLATTCHHPLSTIKGTMQHDLCSNNSLRPNRGARYTESTLLEICAPVVSGSVQLSKLHRKQLDCYLHGRINKYYEKVRDMHISPVFESICNSSSCTVLNQQKQMNQMRLKEHNAAINTTVHPYYTKNTSSIDWP